MPRNRTRLLTLLPYTLALLLGVLLALRGLLAWQDLQRAPTPEQQSAGAAVTAPAAAGPDYARIAGLHLFGAVPAPGAEPAREAQPQETTLPLTLHGVLLDPQVRAAIIGQGGQQHYVRVGGRVPGGGVLQEVDADRIVFERNGRREALSFPRPAEGG